MTKTREEAFMKLGTALLAGAVVFFTAAGSEAKTLKCASPVELSAMVTVAVQQELMDAALTCGDTAKTNYNSFQTRFGPELRETDKMMNRMFSRVVGGGKGDSAYNLFKTELAGRAELRRLHNHNEFCKAANLLVAGALGPAKIALTEFVDGVATLDISGPVSSCTAGIGASSPIVPKPNPMRVAGFAPVPPASAPDTAAALAPPAIASRTPLLEAARAGDRAAIRPGSSTYP